MTFWKVKIALPVALGFHCTLINALNSVPERTMRAPQSPYVERVCRTKCANPLPFVGAPTTSALWHQPSLPRQPLIVITHQTTVLLSQFYFWIRKLFFRINSLFWCRCNVWNGFRIKDLLVWVLNFTLICHTSVGLKTVRKYYTKVNKL